MKEEALQDSPLSGRETQILELALTGCSDKQVGNHLGISLGSVKTYWERLRKKLGAVNRMHAAGRAIEAMPNFLTRFLRRSSKK